MTLVADGVFVLKALRVLTICRVRTSGVQGNQIHSGTLWTLRIQKM